MAKSPADIVANISLSSSLSELFICLQRFVLAKQVQEVKIKKIKK